MYLLIKNNKSAMQARETCNICFHKECSNEKFCLCERVCLGTEFIWKEKCLCEPLVKIKCHI